MSQTALVEVDPLPPAARKPSALTRRMRLAESEVEACEAELESAIEHLEYLERLLVEQGDLWPDRHVLLAVYGAPGNWPVAPA